MVIVNMQIHRPDKMIIFLGLTVHSISLFNMVFYDNNLVFFA